MCNSIAKHLKERQTDVEFSGLVVGKKFFEFLKKQKEVEYKHLELVQDIYQGYEKEEVDMDYLNELEKKYGMPNLWPFVYADRDIILYNKFAKYSYEDYLKLLQRFLTRIEELVEKAKPDVVIFDCVASMPSLILYQIAQKKNIPTLIFTCVRVKNWMTFSYDTFEGFNKVKENFESGKIREDKRLEAIEFLKEYRSKKIVLEYMQTNYDSNAGRQSVGYLIKRIARVPHYVYEYYFGDYSKDYVFKNKGVIKAAQDELKKNVQRMMIKKTGVFVKPNFKEKFVFFPMHFEPETSTMIQAPAYVNQINLIENIAKSLPIEYKLYVKEHPQMIADGTRSFSHYQKLREIPNVVLVDPNVDAHEYIKHCSLVTTINGTVGWEAILLKKPVITFGRVFYNYLSFVQKCTEIDKLPKIIERTLERNPHNEKELIDFLAVVLEASFQANYYTLWVQHSYEKVRDHPHMKIIA